MESPLSAQDVFDNLDIILSDSTMVNLWTSAVAVTTTFINLSDTNKLPFWKFCNIGYRYNDSKCIGAQLIR